MRLAVALVAVSLVAAGCVDAVKCHAPSPWTACADGMAEPGASGTPPTIASLMMPTCAYSSEPVVSGPLDVSDPDGDAQTVKVSLYVGARQAESELMLPPAKGNDAALTLNVAIPMAREGAYDVRIKAVDRAGGQSAPVCNTITVFH